MASENEILTPKELGFLCEEEVIQTKNSVLTKVERLLSITRTELKPILNDYSNPIYSGSLHGKISKGENYLGLPYRILDFPRYKKEDGLFYYRTMVWWGQFFSCTLHLEGRLATTLLPKLAGGQSFLANQNFYLSVGDDQWNHQFEPLNYQLVSKLSQDSFVHYLSNRGFIKLSKRYELNLIHRLPDLSVETFSILSSLFFD